MINYSEIRENIEIQPLSDAENIQAYATHYLHNLDNGVSHMFKEPAEKYLSKYSDKLPPLSQGKINFNWDIPFPTPAKPKFKFIDLFAGIGGIRIAYQKVGGKCVFSSEYNKFAKVTYEANFGEVPFGDITIIDEKSIPDHDILLGGFPCQPFSIAGVSKKNSLGRNHGFLDETQGTLFFDIARIIKEKRPKAFMLENVKNLVSHDKGRTFNIIRNSLDELGYSVYHQVLDGKHFVPQHRERIIIVGFDKSIFKGIENFSFPELPESTRTIREILEEHPSSKYTLSNKLWNYLKDYAAKHKAKGNGFGFGLTNLDGISRTISARYYKDGSEILIPQNGQNPRRLTPRECARLQGFPDEFIIPVSDTQAYKQFGNSVVMPLMHSVAEQVVKVFNEFHESN
ncbi:MAG TPA: DNA (cytosine-5-)-methyltransferase [Bacteroidales bacterium]|jgi:DNA (cytosine-5)-methyltransferase 1|nr:DNA (cytosine-5-)-methyltransferase [Bacteroidales bacterium]